MATKRRRKKASPKNYMTAAGGCKFGKVKSGKRKGQCRTRKVTRRKKG